MFIRRIAATVTAACSSPSDGDDKAITIGYMPAWTDTLSSSHLLKNKLEDAGYSVELHKLGDAAVFYTALSKGDLDIFPLAWSERTHRQYMEKYKDDIEDLGVGFSGAQLFWAVPEYVDDINSIEDLKKDSERFNNHVVGIEPGAGLTDLSEQAMSDYAMEDAGYSLDTSSTPAMLSELESAIENRKTLWSPCGVRSGPTPNTR